MPINNYIHKKYLLLNLIHHLEPISRTELSELTDYRPASISTIIRDLMDEGFIIETGFASNGPGRKRTLLEMNKTHLCAIGLSFSPRHVSYLVSQVDGTILHQSKEAIDPSASKDVLVAEVLEQISILINSFHSRKLIGIGISEPPYDPAFYHPSNSLLDNYTHFNSWVHQKLKPQLEKLSNLPVQTYSGVTMPAMAEYRFGVAKGIQNFICVELSNGIGASICCNGIAVSGEYGKAAELGHTVINYNPNTSKLCYCGKPNCIETSTAFPALVSRISKALDDGVLSILKSYPEIQNGITLEAIRWALDMEDPMCRYYVKDIAVHLGVAISNAVNLLNPKMVVLYGFMIELGDFFLQELKSSIQENVFAPLRNFEICISNSTETLFGLGAVAEIYSYFFKEDNYRWIYQLDPNDYHDKA